MQKRNIDLLEQNKNVYDFYKLTGELKHISNALRQELLNVAREEWAPNYLCCLHCSGDVIKLVEYVYKQYEKVIAQELHKSHKKKK